MGETPEARARTKSAKPRKDLTEEENLKKNSAHGEGEEKEGELGDVDKHEDLSSREESKSHHTQDTNDEEDSPRESFVEVKDSTTRKDSNAKCEGESEVEDDDVSEELVIMEIKVEKIWKHKERRASRRSKRRSRHVDSEKSSSLTPPNHTRLYSKRRKGNRGPNLTTPATVHAPPGLQILS